MSRLNWYGDEAMKVIEGATWDGLRAGALFFHGQLVEAVGIPNTGVSVPKKGGGTRTIYPNPAPKGSPPRKRTGFFQRNIAVEYDKPKLIVRIGVRRNAMYGVFLELMGWPWLLSTLRKVWGKLRQTVEQYSGRKAG